MLRKGPDRRIGLRRKGQHLPVPPAIARALDCAGVTGRTVAGRDEEGPRVVGLLREVAAIAELEPVGDPEPAPALAAVVACEDLARCTGQDRGAAIDRDRNVVDVGIGDPLRRDPGPAVATIGAAPEAIDLDPGPDNAMVRGIDGQRRDPRYADVGAFVGDVGRQLLPMRAAIGRAEECRGPRTGEDDVGIDRIDRDPPDIEAVHRRVEALEALPAVAAFVDAVIGAGEDRARLLAVHGQPEHSALAPQPLADPPPALAAIRTEPRAAPYRPDADREIACHGPVLRSRSVIPGRRAAASPEPIFQRPVFMGSGPDPAGRPGMTPVIASVRAFPAGVRDVDDDAIGAGPFHLEIRVAAGRHRRVDMILGGQPLAVRALKL